MCACVCVCVCVYTSVHIDPINSCTYPQRVAGIVDGYRRTGTFPQEGPSMANHLGEVRTHVRVGGVFRRMQKSEGGDFFLLLYTLS